MSNYCEPYTIVCVHLKSDAGIRSHCNKQLTYKMQCNSMSLSIYMIVVVFGTKHIEK